MATALIVGTGLTVIVNVIGVPVQVNPPLVYEGVTVNVEVTGVVPALAAVNEGTLAVPEFTPSPIASVVLLQVYTAPGILPAKTIEGTTAPAQ